VLTPGSPPASALGPSVSATSSTSGNVTGKGADIVTLRASSAFQTVYVSIGGVDGYLQLALAAPVTELTVALDTASNLPRSSFTTSYRVASSTGLIGAATTISNVVSPPANLRPANDSYSMTKGTTFTVSAPGVLGNDLLGSSSGARVDFLEFSGARPLPANVTSFQNSGNGDCDLQRHDLAALRDLLLLRRGAVLQHHRDGGGCGELTQPSPNRRDTIRGRAVRRALRWPAPDGDRA
jgi:hypothetical protein